MEREVEVFTVRSDRNEWTRRIRMALYEKAYAERFPEVTRDPVTE